MRNPKEAPNLIGVLAAVAIVFFVIFCLPIIVVFGLPVFIFLVVTGTLGTTIGSVISWFAYFR